MRKLYALALTSLAIGCKSSAEVPPAAPPYVPPTLPAEASSTARAPC